MMIGLESNTVELYPHLIEWEDNAIKTIRLIKNILGDICIDAQHVGSTAIYNISAKPIIDIAIAVNNLKDIHSYVNLLNQNGIIYRKIEQTGQLLFIMGNSNNNIKTHHIHVMKYDSQNWIDYLNFRDYLNTFPNKAKEYNDLKIKLANKYFNNRKEYTLGKKELIEQLLKEAYLWRNSQTY